MNDGYLNGIGGVSTERIRGIDDQGQRVVLVDGHPSMRWRSTDVLMERKAEGSRIRRLITQPVDYAKR